MTRDVFVEADGQDDNLGDSLLRRAFLDSLRAPQVRLHVLLDGTSAQFRSGLALRSEDHVYEHRLAWARAAIRASWRGRADLALNAGEILVNRRRTRFAVLNLVVALSVRARRGTVIWVGAGLRQLTGTWPIVVWLLARTAQVVAWRDGATRSRLGTGEVAPDWAVLTGDAMEHDGTSQGRPRPYLAVSMRGDRPEPAQDWCDQVCGLADQHGLALRTFAQVRRDVECNAELAVRLGGVYVAGPGAGETHADMEREARSLLAETGLVVSDRLHVLLLAVTETAVPVVPGPDPKIHRTLVGAGVTVRSLGDVAAPARIVELQRATADELARARGRLGEVVSLMRSRIVRSVDPRRDSRV